MVDWVEIEVLRGRFRAVVVLDGEDGPFKRGEDGIEGVREARRLGVERVGRRGEVSETSGRWLWLWWWV